MKYARVDGKLRAAETGLRGECVGCDGTMIGNHGEIKRPYWRHESKKHCDPWWENETEWHRNWKNCFRDDWQEIRHEAPDGEVHIADVKTGVGWTIEFQHSKLDPDEQRSREEFYDSLIWVVDGKRLKRDEGYFFGAWGNARVLSGMGTRCVRPGKGSLWRAWTGSPAHVFFDFGDEELLWWLWPGSDDTRAYVRPTTRGEFIRALKHVDKYGPSRFDSLVKHFTSQIAKFANPPPPAPPDPLPPAPRTVDKRPGRRQRFRF